MKTIRHNYLPALLKPWLPLADAAWLSTGGWAATARILLTSSLVHKKITDYSAVLDARGERKSKGRADSFPTV